MSDKKIIIDEEEPFKNDKLDRELIANNLTKIIENKEGSFVLSIDSGWGTGKTTFIEMWVQKLKIEKNVIPIYYNAWENDDFNDPLLAIINSIDEYFNSKRRKKKLYETLDEVKEHSKRVIFNGLKRGIKKATGDIIDPCDFKVFDEYKEYKKNKKGITDSLLKLYYVYKKKIIIFIDELDRCRPTFAIETLERIKHIFDVPGFVFVLSVDKDQLAHSVKGLYGQDMDSQGYLRRFIDLEYRLPEPDRFKYFELYKKEIKIQDYPHINNFWRMLKSLVSSLKLSLRDINKLFIYLELWIPTSTLLKNSDNYEKHIIGVIASFLIALKLTDQKAYWSIYNKVIDNPEELKTEKGYKINFHNIKGENDEPQNAVFIQIITQFITLYNQGYGGTINGEFKFVIKDNEYLANFLLSDGEFSIFKELEFLYQFQKIEL